MLLFLLYLSSANSTNGRGNGDHTEPFIQQRIHHDMIVIMLLGPNLDIQNPPKIAEN